jgi:catechol 2,3-dioxygenase-like lactoylglutathione lyase family enzyme
MLQVITHIAVTLADPVAAEAFYADLFGMRPVVRESKTADGWKTLDPSIDPARARALGLSIDLVILRGGDAVLAVERSAGAVGRLPDHIGVRMDPAAYASVRAAVRSRGLAVRSDTPDRFVFTDPFGLDWELQTSDAIPTSREMGRGWIDADGHMHAG